MMKTRIARTICGGIAAGIMLIWGNALAAPVMSFAEMVRPAGILSATRYHRFSADHRVEIYRVRYRSGKLIEIAYLVRPRQLGGKVPVLVFNPGGSGANSRVLRYLSGIAADGPYVVLANQYRGIEGGEGVDEYGGSDVQDVLRLVEVAKRLPFAKPETGVLGFSRGGMMTYLALKAGAPVQAAAVVSAPTDMTETYDHLGGIRGYFVKRRIAGAIGGNPEQVPQRYRDRSARFWPQDIHVPLLIVQGDADDLVPADQVTRFAGELSALGSRYKLVMIRRGDHMLHSSSADRDWAILDWFHTYLN